MLQPAPATQPPLTAAAKAALDKLADVAVPAPVPWTPQTWGWAALAVALLAFATWIVVRAVRHKRANRYRAEALSDLTALESRLLEADDRAAAVAAMPELVKRVALAAWPRPEVASLSGEPWIAFLRAHSGGVGFPDEAARLIGGGEYQTTSLSLLSVDDAQHIARQVRRWIEGHRVRP